MSFLSSGILALFLVAADAPPRIAHVADAITLKDGKVALGALVEPAPRGQTQFLVRREWARENIPEWLDRWEAADAPASKPAQRQRKARLDAWRKERSPEAGKKDVIVDWIDRESARLSDPIAWKNTPLLLVKPGRNEVKSIARAARGAGRLLKFAWLANFPKPETQAVDALKTSLEGRGFDVADNTPVSVDSLLPLSSETDRTWLLRRAATEISVDPGLKLINYQGLVLPEPADGQGIGGLDPKAALAGLKQILGDDNPGDSLMSALKAIGAKGKVGALVTRLDVAPDFTAVSVDITLWVRSNGGQWTSAGTRAARVRPEDLAPDAGKDLAADPQVSLAFQVVESLGLGSIPADMKQRSLNIGAATRKALSLARAAVQNDLPTLPVTEPPRP